MGTTPQGRGRYPDYDVLENRDHWDAATRDLVMKRVEDVPPIRFFVEPGEARTLAAFCDCVMAQHREPRIPVLNFVDDKLHAGRLDGFQHDGMPDDRVVWRTVARELAALGFADLPLHERQAVCARFAEGRLRLPFDASTAWSVVMRAILEAFYSHPWAWNEIGFGGPAYPRGYSRLRFGMREEWEGEEELEGSEAG